MEKMFMHGVFLCIWACCLSVGNSQPVTCTDGGQCDDDYYCDLDVKMCRECLSCQELKRESPVIQTDCIKSIDKCGDCFKGFVKDRLGDVNSACVLASFEESSNTPQYVWWLIGSLVLFFIIVVVVIVIYISVYPSVFKTFGNCGPGTVSTNICTAMSRPSAPDMPPPPYTPPQYDDGPFSPARDTESPYPPHSEAGDARDLHSEDECPLIKPSLRPHEGREPSANQAANVFQLPIYDRNGDPPRSASPIVEEVVDNFGIHDETTTPSPWTPGPLPNIDIHDETTTPSGWTPGPSPNGDINANNASETEVAVPGPGLSEMLRAARNTDIIQHTPPKQLRVSLPNSNSRNSNPSGDSNTGSFSGNQNGPSQMTQINANLVIQFNNNS